MEIFKLFGSILVNTDEAEQSISKVDKKAGGFASKLGSGIATAAKWSAGLIGAAASASAGVVGAISQMDEATEEYRTAMGKLNAAFEAAGSDADMASYAYGEFYKILGDVDTATEASQLLAQLSTDGEDIAYWTHIAAGAYAAFGDALPIEGLIEAANETAKVGEVTGSLADALNWVGLSEEDVNKKLSELSSETERADYIMNLLMDTYDSTADSFWENNEQLVKSREAQTQLNNAMVDAGETIAELKSQFSSMGTGLLTQLMPTIQSILDIIQENMPLVQQIFEQIAPVIVGMVEALLPHLLSLVDTVLPVFVELLNLLVPVFVEIVETILPVVISLIETLLPPLMDIIETLLPVLLDLLRPILDLLQPIIDLLSPLLELVVAFLEPLTQLLGDILTPIIAKATEIAEKIIGKVTEALKGIADYMKSFIPNMIQSGKDLFNGLWDGAKNIWDSIQSWTTEKLGWILTAVLEKAGQIVSRVKDSLQNLLGALTGFVPNMVQAGKKLFNGLWDGVKGIWSSMQSWVTEKINWLLDKITFWDNSKSAMADGSHASGLPYVPYDGYRAILHRGESVLNAADTSSLLENIKALAATGGSSEPITIVVKTTLDGKQIGESVTKYQRNQARAVMG